MKYTGWIVAAVIVLVAWAGPDPACPSDLNSDGNVGTPDLLQVLADWGPCPGPPRVVAISNKDTSNFSITFRLWSDNRVEGTTYAEFICGRGECPSDPFPLNEWFEVDAPPQPPGETPVGLSYDGRHLWVAYSGGTAFRRIVLIGHCSCANGGETFSIGEMLPWEDFPPP